MPGELIRVAGPAGAGKSGIARSLLAAGEADVLADTTAIFAALSGQERDASGLYPVRADDALLLPIALYIRQTVVLESLRRELRVIKTSSTPTDADADRLLALEHGATFRQRIVDPGESVIRARLVDPQTGQLSPECEKAIGRWYRPGQTGAHRVGGRVETPRPRRGRRR